ncbi:MAG: DNA replication and repair protein RecF [Tannerellaceae bacterium]|jgi:DNA replication and repair protein RecF|nr:DNA replication and repair protein RecF [Tannerellaceae bacterium]
MILKRISILNFKNIQQADISFSPGMNCFFGNNGMGKTNLLDAVYYLSFCKSHLNAADSQLVMHNHEVCVLQGNYECEGRDENILCAIRPGHKKQFSRNKKEYDRLSEHIGLLPIVMVSPADSELVRGGSGERRRLLDMIISQHNRKYLYTLIHYNKILQQRNALLRNRASDPSLYEVIEMQLELYGMELYKMRREMTESFLPLFKSCYKNIGGSAEEVDIAYISQMERGSLAKDLAESRERDMKLGFTSCGVHKDELEMKLGNSLIRRIGSQGQTKTFLIALKLAQFIFLKQKGETTPLLLLDDIFDKLDAERVERIVRLVNDPSFGQIFITDTNRKYLDLILLYVGAPHELFKVENGAVGSIGRS